MKISDALKHIDAGWVRKPKGFRVRFNVYADGRWDTDTCPGEPAAPFDSDVTAWRTAWKLAQANHPEPSGPKDGDLANIKVVDDQGSPIRSYITNEFEVYHPQEETSAAETGNGLKKM